MASSATNMEKWEKSWRDHVADLRTMGCRVPYDTSADRMRRLVQSDLLRHEDITECPERFILAHRVLAELATSNGPGFWIRFTVHFNLMAGTVMALGSPEQVATLREVQKAGKLGCFGLTEKFAGVNSGLVVNTTCTWDPKAQNFVLHSPDKGAHKNWISQGLEADVCVVVADLIVEGKSHGPNAFFMELRRDGQLVEGVAVGDMGVKTIGNDLDNAWISFTNVRLPKAALLSRYAAIEGDKFVQQVKGIRTMDMIGQRLYTGRAVIARSALVFARTLYESTRQYTDNKKIWAPKGAKMSLSDVPQLANLFTESDKELSHLEGFVGEIEKSLCECLRSNKIPPTQLVEAIATSKVKAVETAIDLCWKLKQEVGSYALMTGVGFEQLDYLQCCKFAEGDSRILMQKMSRDRLKAFAKGQRGTGEEASLCEALTKDASNHLLIYQLAEAVMSRNIRDFLGNTSKL